MEFRSTARIRRMSSQALSLSLPVRDTFPFPAAPRWRGSIQAPGTTYLFRSATGEVEKLAPDAFALGMFESACFQSRKFHLDEGDLLIVYSDGLTDAENPQEEMFGEERLMEIIQREAPGGSRAVEQTILKGIADFTQSMPQTDDITLVVVEKSR
jgi:serine phosphatase RsbU (regulator of sigma subunit)